MSVFKQIFRKKRPIQAEPPLEHPVWASNWEPETAKLAYEAASGLRDVQSAWADSLDTKIVAVFAVGSTILAVVPNLKTPETVVGQALLGVAVVMWVFSCWFCFAGFRPRKFRVGPDPDALLGEDWLSRSPRDFMLWRLRSMARSYEHNSAVLSAKGRALAISLGFTASEVLALTVSLFTVGSC